MDVKERVKHYERFMIDFRRELHMYPEVSFQEFRTALRIREELDKLGVNYVTCGGTGTLATVAGSKPGKTILLRADIDALTVNEKTGLPYASTVDGVMHACGHDCHVAMLLTACAVLNDIKNELCGTVKFIFQPAEEISQGAQAMIDAGVMENVDACFGEHVMSMLPAGKIGFCPGAVMAAAGQFEINVTGKGGHASAPHMGVDAAVVTSAIVMNLQTVVSRELDPLIPNVLTVGEIKVGTRFNVLAENGYISGTYRTFSPEIADRFGTIIERVVSDTAATFRATAETKYRTMCQVTINDTDMLALTRNASEKLFGSDFAVNCEPVTGSEDFSLYANMRQSMFALIGCADPSAKDTYYNHNSLFYVDESALSIGAALYAQVAIDFLAI